MGHKEQLEQIEQIVYQVPNFLTKLNLLKHLVRETETMERVLIFVNNKRIVDLVFETLDEEFSGQFGVIHSNKSQNYRLNTMASFQAGELRGLVTTDIMARGLDISDITHVINLQFTEAPEKYMHRIGRTGRADKTGIAISLVSPSEVESKIEVELLMDTEIKEFGDGTNWLVYTKFETSKHKVFISGKHQDIYDFFLGNDWSKENDTPQKLFKDKLGVESYRETLRKNKKFPNTLISNDVNASENGKFWVDSEQAYMMRQKGYTTSMSPKQVRDLDKTMAKQGFKWDNKAGRYPERSGGAYVDRKGKRLDFDNYKPF